MLVVVSLFWFVVVSWKLLLFWAVQPKWAVTERLFIAKPLISCHDGSETNTQYCCLGETSFWMDFKLWCTTESNSLPSSTRTAVGAHPPCWRIKQKPISEAMERQTPCHSTRHQQQLECEITVFLIWVAHGAVLLSSAKRPPHYHWPREAWDVSPTYTIFPLEIINAAPNQDFPAKKSLLITLQRAWNFALRHYLQEKLQNSFWKFISKISSSRGFTDPWKYLVQLETPSVFFLHSAWECFDTVWVMMEDVKAAEMLRAYRTCDSSKQLCGKGELILNTEKISSYTEKKALEQVSGEVRKSVSLEALTNEEQQVMGLTRVKHNPQSSRKPSKPMQWTELQQQPPPPPH